MDRKFRSPCLQTTTFTTSAVSMSRTRSKRYKWRASSRGVSALTRWFLLMVSVTGGVRFVQMHAPLAAQPVTARTYAGTTRFIQLKGSIGSGDKLVYSVASQPAHGTVKGNAAIVSYTPAPGFVGTDTFSYRVRYGRATVEASVSVLVTPARYSQITFHGVENAARHVPRRLTRSTRQREVDRHHADCLHCEAVTHRRAESPILQHMLRAASSSERLPLLDCT